MNRKWRRNPLSWARLVLALAFLGIGAAVQLGNTTSAYAGFVCPARFGVPSLSDGTYSDGKFTVTVDFTQAPTGAPKTVSFSGASPKVVTLMISDASGTQVHSYSPAVAADSTPRTGPDPDFPDQRGRLLLRPVDRDAEPDSNRHSDSYSHTHTNADSDADQDTDSHPDAHAEANPTPTKPPTATPAPTPTPRQRQHSLAEPDADTDSRCNTVAVTDAISDSPTDADGVIDTDPNTFANGATSTDADSDSHAVAIAFSFPTPEPPVAPPPPSASSGGGLAASIRPFDELGSDSAVIAQSLLLALLFMLLAAFPGQLLNKTVEENYAEISGWFAASKGWTARVGRSLSSFWKSPVGLGLFVALSALLFGFLSPQFGLTFESVASFLGILVGLVIVIATFELPVVLVQRRRFADWGRLQVQPLTIFIAVVCVVLSRIADFQPGYLYGLVIGFEFARSLPVRQEGRSHALTAVVMLVVALSAWMLLPLAETATASIPLAQTAVAAALATIFIAGLEGMLFELVPVRFLRGQSVFAWRRAAWATLFLAAAFSFVHILLTPKSGFLGSTQTSPLLAAVILFAGFGLFSVGFWAYFRYRPSQTNPTQTGVTEAA